jgi:hypothetical protein
MLGFIPLHLSALQQSETLKAWIHSWLGNQAKFLEPADWFERGHNMSGGSKDSKGYWRQKFSQGLLCGLLRQPQPTLLWKSFERLGLKGKTLFT